MKFTLNESASLPITCPQCGHQHEQLLSRLRDNPQLICPACATAFLVNADQLDAVMKIFEGANRKPT